MPCARWIGIGDETRNGRAGSRRGSEAEVLPAASTHGQGGGTKNFAAAGIFTGLGLWIGATVQFFGIAALAAGAVLLAFFMPGTPDESGDRLHSGIVASMGNMGIDGRDGILSGRVFPFPFGDAVGSEQSRLHHCRGLCR